MSNLISIKNLNFSYKDQMIFKDFNLNIECGSFVSLIGPNGSGKSTLVKIISGLLEFDGEIILDDLLLNSNNINQLRPNIGVIFNNVDNQLISESVFDNISFSLQNLGISKDEIFHKVSDIANLLNISYLLKENIFNLNNMEKNLVNLASVLVYNPKLLILDEAFSTLDKFERNKIFEILKNLNKNQNLTIINVTQNMEDTLYGNLIIILDHGKIIQFGNNDEVFQNDRYFSKLGLSLPFMVDLSIKLKYYNLIDRIIYDMEEMVDVLWK